MQNLTKLVAIGLLVAIACTVMPSQADAILSADIRGGYYTDAEEFFLGGGLRIGLVAFEVIPNFEECGELSLVTEFGDKDGGKDGGKQLDVHKMLPSLRETSPEPMIGARSNGSIPVKRVNRARSGVGNEYLASQGEYTPSVSG